MLGIIAFILAEAIPVFYSIVALSGAICFAPMSLCLPAWFWLYDHPEYRSNTAGRKALYCLHCFFLLLGAFITVAGTYGTVQQIVDSYADGSIGTSTSPSIHPCKRELTFFKGEYSVVQITRDPHEELISLDFARGNTRWSNL